MENYANVSLNVDSISSTGGTGEVTTLPLERVLWGE